MSLQGGFDQGTPLADANRRRVPFMLASLVSGVLGLGLVIFGIVTVQAVLIVIGGVLLVLGLALRFVAFAVVNSILGSLAVDILGLRDPVSERVVRDNLGQIMLRAHKRSVAAGVPIDDAFRAELQEFARQTFSADA